MVATVSVEQRLETAFQRLVSEKIVEATTVPSTLKEFLNSTTIDFNIFRILRKFNHKRFFGDQPKSQKILNPSMWCLFSR